MTQLTATKPIIFSNFENPEQNCITLRLRDLSPGLRRVRENWWKIHKQQNDEENDDDIKQREPFGLKQAVMLPVGLTYATALSFIFRNEPVIRTGLTGILLDFVKTSYAYIPSGSGVQWGFRLTAAASLITLITLNYVPQDPYYIVQFLKYLPFLDMTMAVFVKGDLKRFKLDAKIVQLFARWDIQLSKKKVKFVNSLVQGSLAASLMMPQIFGIYLAAVGGVLFRPHMRVLVFTGLKRIEQIEDKKTQNIVLATLHSSLIGGAIGTYFLLKNDLISHSPLNLLPLTFNIVTVYILLRTIKQVIKAYIGIEGAVSSEIPPTCRERSIIFGKGLCILGIVIGFSILFGDQIVSSATSSVTSRGNSITTNPGFLVVLLQEVVEVLKIGTIKIMPQNVALGMVTAMVGIGAALNIFRQPLSINEDTVGYGTCLFMVLCFMNLSLAFVKRDLKPPRKKQTPLLQIEARLEGLAEL